MRTSFLCSKCGCCFEKGSGLARHFQATLHGPFHSRDPKKHGRKKYSFKRKRDALIELDKAVALRDPAAQSNLANRLGISQSLISKWNTNRMFIFEMAAVQGKSKLHKARPSKADYPHAETRLYVKFVYRRNVQGLKTSRRWLARHFRVTLIELGIDPSGCAFSGGLISNFCRRWAISNQCRTNKKQLSVEARLPQIQGFHRYLHHGIQRTLPQRCPKYGRFPPDRMFHFDQVPVAFCSSQKKTLNPVGSRCIRLSEPKGGTLSKRQGTINLTIRAEGEQVVKPEMIFRGEECPTEGEEAELYKRLTNIKVRFQRKAWADEKICIEFLEDFREQTLDIGEVLLGCDNHGSQQTPACRAFMQLMDIVPAWTPADCTDVVSPVDKNVGNYFQKKMGLKYDALNEEKQEAWEDGGLQQKDIRMMMATWLSETWDETINDGHSLMTLFRRAFVATGFLVANDGSENHLIQMDGWTGAPGSYTF